MEHFDEILLEQYFTYINMSEENRNNFINILLHTKDIYDSEKNLEGAKYSNFDLLTLHLMNREGIVKFNGAVYNDYENRIIDGIIYSKSNKIYVNTTIYRLNDFVSDKEYNVNDTFVFKDGRVIRRSVYDDGKYFEDEILLMNNQEVQEYLENKVDNMKKGRY